MKIKLKFFANLRDMAGTDEIDMVLEDDVVVADLMRLIMKKLPALKNVLETRKIFISVNQEMAHKELALKDGDEVGLLPPFSGG